MDLTHKPPWSKKSIDRLGKALRDDEPLDNALYAEFLLWAGDIIVAAQQLIHDALQISDRWEIDIPAKGIRVIERIPVKLTGRPKTIDTTRDKLLRMPEFKLSRIQDISGVRLDGDFSLDQQDLIVNRLKTAFWEAGAQSIKIEDLREQTRYGYRGLHVNANFPAGRLEVQTRTKLQSAWANTYELLGDIFGREIRYSPANNEPLRSLVSTFGNISNSGYVIDQSINSINGTAIGLKTSRDSVPKDTSEWKKLNATLEQTLGARAQALGNQIDVVDILDNERRRMIAKRAGVGKEI